MENGYEMQGTRCSLLEYCNKDIRIIVFNDSRYLVLFWWMESIHVDQHAKELCIIYERTVTNYVTGM